MTEIESLDCISPEDKKMWLFNRQKEILDTFLKTNAIDKKQYNKSLGDLSIKMGISLEEVNE